MRVKNSGRTDPQKLFVILGVEQGKVTLRSVRAVRRSRLSQGFNGTVLALSTRELTWSILRFEEGVAETIFSVKDRRLKPSIPIRVRIEVGRLPAVLDAS